MARIGRNEETSAEADEKAITETEEEEECYTRA
jgi:hypothetical protein